jgi:hypothetical protein
MQIFISQHLTTILSIGIPQQHTNINNMLCDIGRKIPEKAPMLI